MSCPLLHIYEKALGFVGTYTYNFVIVDAKVLVKTSSLNEQFVFKYDGIQRFNDYALEITRFFCFEGTYFYVVSLPALQRRRTFFLLACARNSL